jgi:hypothetical protein
MFIAPRENSLEAAMSLVQSGDICRHLHIPLTRVWNASHANNFMEDTSNLYVKFLRYEPSVSTSVKVFN